jgi:hypothetical protein
LAHTHLSSLLLSKVTNATGNTLSCKLSFDARKLSLPSASFAKFLPKHRCLLT